MISFSIKKWTKSAGVFSPRESVLASRLCCTQASFASSSEMPNRMFALIVWSKRIGRMYI